jgi:hypothetical protein
MHLIRVPADPSIEQAKNVQKTAARGLRNQRLWPMLKAVAAREIRALNKPFFDLKCDCVRNFRI